MINRTYAVEEIFQDIPNNDENVLMTIPPEVANELGWKPGDVLKVKWEDGSISITKVDNGKE